MVSARRLITEAHRFLRPGGRLLLEIGHDQQAGIRQIVASSGQYDNLVFTRDYAGYDRVAKMRKKPDEPQMTA